jgi:uncharacterized cofD-like protein
VCGETAIVASGRRINRIYLDPPDCVAQRDALQAIRDADVICIGPGSVFTSVIPNLLVPGVAEALKESKALKIYICNVMTQPGESDSFTASNHVSTIMMNAQERVFDYVLVNTERPSEEVLAKYLESNQHLVEPDVDRVQKMGFKVLRGNLMSVSDVVRHDPMKVAERVMQLLARHSGRGV